jgi:hypothetical protein
LCPGTLKPAEKPADRVHAHPNGFELFGQIPWPAWRNLLARQPTRLALLLKRLGDGNGVAREALCEKRRSEKPAPLFT